MSDKVCLKCNIDYTATYRFCSDCGDDLTENTTKPEVVVTADATSVSQPQSQPAANSATDSTTLSPNTTTNATEQQNAMMTLPPVGENGATMPVSTTTNPSTPSKTIPNKTLPNHRSSISNSDATPTAESTTTATSTATAASHAGSQSATTATTTPNKTMLTSSQNGRLFPSPSSPTTRQAAYKRSQTTKESQSPMKNSPTTPVRTSSVMKLDFATMLEFSTTGAQSDRSLSATHPDKLVLRDGKRVPPKTGSKEYVGRDSHDRPGMSTNPVGGVAASKRTSMYHTEQRRNLAERKFQTVKSQRKPSDTELDEISLNSLASTAATVSKNVVVNNHIKGLHQLLETKSKDSGSTQTRLTKKVTPTASPMALNMIAQGVSASSPRYVEKSTSEIDLDDNGAFWLGENEKDECLAEVVASSARDYEFLRFLHFSNFGGREREKEDLVYSILKIYQHQGNDLELVFRMVDLEIECAETSIMLFRGDAFSTRVVRAFIRLCGIQYLNEFIGPTVLQMCKEDVHLLMDKRLDPNAREGDGFDEPDEKLVALAHLWVEKFLNAIFSSRYNLPLVMSRLMNYVLTNALKKFPDASSRGIMSSIIFLRFFNPFITSPNNFGMKKPSHRHQTSLLLIGKVVQSLANGQSGFKEISMKCLEPLLTKYSVPMRQYYRDIAQWPRRVDSSLDACSLLSRFIFAKRADILNAMRSNPEKWGELHDTTYTHILHLQPQNQFEELMKSCPVTPNDTIDRINIQIFPTTFKENLLRSLKSYYVDNLYFSYGLLSSFVKQKHIYYSFERCVTPFIGHFSLFKLNENIEKLFGLLLIIEYDTIDECLYVDSLTKHIFRHYLQKSEVKAWIGAVWSDLLLELNSLTQTMVDPNALEVKNLSESNFLFLQKYLYQLLKVAIPQLKEISETFNTFCSIISNHAQASCFRFILGSFFSFVLNDAEVQGKIELNPLTKQVLSLMCHLVNDLAAEKPKFFNTYVVNKAEVNGLKELFGEYVDSLVLARGRVPSRDAVTRSNSNDSADGFKMEGGQSAVKSELMILCDISDYVLSEKEELFSIFTNERIDVNYTLAGLLNSMTAKPAVAKDHEGTYIQGEINDIASKFYSMRYYESQIRELASADSNSPRAKLMESMTSSSSMAIQSSTKSAASSMTGSAANVSTQSGQSDAQGDTHTKKSGSVRSSVLFGGKSKSNARATPDKAFSDKTTKRSNPKNSPAKFDREAEKEKEKQEAERLRKEREEKEKQHKLERDKQAADAEKAPKEPLTQQQQPSETRSEPVKPEPANPVEPIARPNETASANTTEPERDDARIAREIENEKQVVDAPKRLDTIDQSTEAQVVIETQQPENPIESTSEKKEAKTVEATEKVQDSVAAEQPVKSEEVKPVIDVEKPSDPAMQPTKTEVPQQPQENVESNVDESMVAVKPDGENTPQAATVEASAVSEVKTDADQSEKPAVEEKKPQESQEKMPIESHQEKERDSTTEESKEANDKARRGTSRKDKKRHHHHRDNAAMSSSGKASPAKSKDKREHASHPRHKRKSSKGKERATGETKPGEAAKEASNAPKEKKLTESVRDVVTEKNKDEESAATKGNDSQQPATTAEVKDKPVEQSHPDESEKEKAVASEAKKKRSIERAKSEKNMGQIKHRAKSLKRVGKSKDRPSHAKTDDGRGPIEKANSENDLARRRREGKSPRASEAKKPIEAATNADQPQTGTAKLSEQNTSEATVKETGKPATTDQEAVTSKDTQVHTVEGSEKKDEDQKKTAVDNPQSEAQAQSVL